MFPLNPVDGFSAQELSTCGNPPDLFCVRVLRATHSTWLAGSSPAIVRLAHVLVIVVVAVAARHIARRVIRRIAASTAEGRAGRSLARLPSVDASPAAVTRRISRATTVGQVLRSCSDVAILVIAAMLVLGELGLNLAPIIASAGIVGLALGFGAQSLVKDVLAGLFIVMEDQYGVGDRVSIQGQTGTVEMVGLRVTRILEDNGTVWYVRNGEVLVVGNLSQSGPQAPAVPVA